MDPADRRCLSEDRSANSIATLKKEPVCGSEMHKALLHVIDILCRKAVWLWKPVSWSRKPTQKSGGCPASNHVLMRCGRLPTDARSLAFGAWVEAWECAATNLATNSPRIGHLIAWVCGRGEGGANSGRDGSVLRSVSVLGILFTNAPTGEPCAPPQSTDLMRWAAIRQTTVRIGRYDG